MKILFSELQTLITSFKVIKSDVVYLKGQKLYGFDSTFTVVKEMNFNNPNQLLLVIQIKEWMELFKQLDLDKSNKTIDLGIEFILFKGKEYYLRSSYILRELDRKIDVIHNIQNNILSNVHIDSLRDEEGFKPILDKDLKSSDGVYLYRLKQYCISVYKTLLGITAKDDISLDIFDYSKLYIMARYTLTSKKNDNIYIYLGLRKLP